VLLFAGTDLVGTYFGDTWEWDGDNWTQIEDIGPSARAFHATAHDSARGRVVLFGGIGPAGRLADTWEWDGQAWTQVGDSGPDGRTGHAMAYDATRQRVVLFGGDAGSLRGDTWEWDGSDWTQREDTGPSARTHAAMAHDVTRGRTVLFGGAAPDAGLGDTWEWDGTAWTEVEDTGPDPCAGAAMVSSGGGAVLYGGASSIGPAAAPTLFGRSWQWDGNHWTAYQDMGPGNRAFHAAAFDAARRRIVLFGGADVLTSGVAPGSVRGDTWEQPSDGIGLVGVKSVDVSPNPAPYGPVTLTVTLTGPATDNVSVETLVDGTVVGTADVAAGSSSVDAGVWLEWGPSTYTVAARVGTSEASTTVTIDNVAVDVASLSAQPNPAVPNQPLDLIVTLAAPAPQATGVQLLQNDQPFGSISVGGGELTGTVSLWIAEDVQPGISTVFTARSGMTEASVTVSIPM
jgi:hypothetical protein